jgi:HK97 family phage major capsid protein
MEKMIQELQGTLGDIKSGVEAQKPQILELGNQTRKAIEELTLVKNRIEGIEAAQTKIERLQLMAKLEARSFYADPMKRLLANEDHRKALNSMFRHVLSRGAIALDKAAPIVSTGTPGSVYIDGQLAREIYDVLSTYGVWNTFRVVPLSTKTTTFPVSTARALANFIMTEGGQVSADTTKEATSVDLTPKPISTLLYASRDMVEDSEFDLAGMLMEEFVQAFALRMDWACLGADGTSDVTDGGMTGIFSGGTAATAADGNTTVATLQLDDFIRCLTTVAAGVLRRGAKWWIHPTILAKICGIRDESGRPIFQTSLEAPSPGAIGSILGYPVILADAAPSTDSAGSVVAAFGDPAGQVVGIRTAFEFAASDEFAFDYLRRYYRGVTRFGNKIRAATAFAKLTLAAA